MKARFLFVFACVMIAALCLRAEDRMFDVTGTIRGRLDNGSLIIEHQNIPGFMPAMTMAFEVANPDEASGLQTGDTVRFRLRVSDDKSVAESFFVTGHEAVIAKAKSAEVKRLHEGDLVPPFSLIDERGRPVTEASLRGHSTVITFIFTRCPVPEFCPAMALKFASLQESLVASGTPTGSVRLMSVSLDPEFDRPEILRMYGDAVGANPAIWGFATGETAEAATLAREFSVYTERDGALLNHTLCTALIGPDGRVRELWRGNAWKTSEVLAALGIPMAN